MARAPKPIAHHAEHTVGMRLRAARLARGLTLAQLGGADLSRSFLSSVEHGRSRLSLRSLAIVAARLDVPVSYLLQEPGEDASYPPVGHHCYDVLLRRSDGQRVLLELTIRGAAVEEVRRHAQS